MLPLHCIPPGTSGRMRVMEDVWRMAMGASHQGPGPAPGLFPLPRVVCHAGPVPLTCSPVAGGPPHGAAHPPARCGTPSALSAGGLGHRRHLAHTGKGEHVGHGRRPGGEDSVDMGPCCTQHEQGHRLLACHATPATQKHSPLCAAALKSVFLHPMSASTRWSRPSPSRRCTVCRSQGCPQSRKLEPELRKRAKTQCSATPEG